MVMSLALGPKSFGFYVRTQVEWVLSQDPPRPTGLLTYALGPDMDPFLLGQASGPKSLGFRHGPNPLGSRHEPSPQPLGPDSNPKPNPLGSGHERTQTPALLGLDMAPLVMGPASGPNTLGSCLRIQV